MKHDDFSVIENTDESIKKVCSPWGNSTVTITLPDMLALFEGKLLYHFDGEYGTFVELDPDIPICKELRELRQKYEKENNSDDPSN